jgi:hypothetical protein
VTLSSSLDAALEDVYARSSRWLERRHVEFVLEGHVEAFWCRDDRIPQYSSDGIQLRCIRQKLPLVRR